MYQVTLKNIHKVPPTDPNGKAGPNQQTPEDPVALLDKAVPANTVLAGPVSGVDGKPTYRKLTLADLPTDDDSNLTVPDDDSNIVTVSPATQNILVNKSDGLFVPKQPIVPVTLYKLAPGAITDAVTPVVKNGALSTATIAKNGDYDKLTITAGTFQSSIAFTNLQYGNVEFRVKASVQVNALNQDGTTGTTFLGLGQHLLVNTWDTPNGWPERSLSLDLVGLTQVGYETRGNASVGSGGGGIGNVTTVIEFISGDFAVAAGDILDMEYFTDKKVTYKDFLYITNRKNKSWAKLSFNNNAPDNGGYLVSQLNGCAKLVASNGQFTVLDFAVESNVSKNPTLYLVGDSYTEGNHIAYPQALGGLFMADPSLITVDNCSAGSVVQSWASIQADAIRKLQPKYVAMTGVLDQYYGYFIDGNANNAAFMIHWNKLLHTITDAGSIPVYMVWPNGGYSANMDAYFTFVTAQQAIFGGIVVDARTITPTFDDSSHPNAAYSSAVYTLIKTALVTNGL